MQPATNPDSLERALAQVGAQKARWPLVPLATRIDLLRRCVTGTVAVADGMAAAGCRAKGLDPNAPAGAEECLSGPVPVISNLRLLAETLREVQRDGRPRTRILADARVRVFPRDAFDRALYPGVTIDVWIHSRDPVFVPRDPEGGLALVLGAGNVASIGLMDLLYQLFVEDHVVVRWSDPMAQRSNEGAMGTRDKRIDAYIEKSADFAKPILTFIRETVHEACPACDETLKWSMPTFMYRGMLCGMASFKEHATFGFWKHELLLGERDGDAMGSFGRLTSVKDLPSKRQLVGLIKRAMKLNEDGVKIPRMKAAQPKAAIPMPAELKIALAKNKKARATFEAFSPSHKREYLEWIAEAKGLETRARRIATALEWMREGKPRNWKYMRAR